jgi:trigger factor
MNITKTNIDSLNAIVSIAIEKNDYADKVEKLLLNYRKNAAIPGFRKGAVPISLIKKQYGKAILLEELNKIVSENLNKYISSEKIDILGNPLPVLDEKFSIDAEDFNFKFEIGLAPQFEVNLDAKNNLTHYKIIADEQMLTEELQRIQKQFGKMISKNEVEQDHDIRGIFINEEYNINAPAQITLDEFKDKETGKKFIGKKVGDIVTLDTKGLYEDDHKLMDYLKVSHDIIHGLDIKVDFKIEEITTSEPAELNQELFDKLFGEGQVASVAEVKQKIKENAEEQFERQSDQQFLNDATSFLIDSNPIELPSSFLKKWIQTTSENKLSETQAEEEYTKSEKGLRYQLIESKIIQQNNLQITFEELKAYTSNAIRKQMAQFGQLNPTDQDVDGIVARVLSNQEEIKRLSDQIMSEKMIQLLKEKIKTNKKEVSYADFVKEMYGE